ncbi:MAG: hypothetical protein PUC88_05210 [Clostridia bacterium]|nr:hypothetical protein [Clostridia bacterium]
MKSTIFEIVSIISFALSILFLIAAVFVFFKFKIPSVVGYLTGSTARKKIKQMQTKALNEKTGELTGKKVKTDKLVTSSKPKIETQDADSSETTVLDTSQDNNNTTVLNDSGETTVLYNNNLNTVVYDGSNDNMDESGTTQTLEKKESPHTPIVIEYDGKINFSLEQDIKLIHTDEIIH